MPPPKPVLGHLFPGGILPAFFKTQVKFWEPRSWMLKDSHKTTKKVFVLQLTNSSVCTFSLFWGCNNTRRGFFFFFFLSLSSLSLSLSLSLFLSTWRQERGFSLRRQITLFAQPHSLVQSGKSLSLSSLRPFSLFSLSPLSSGTFDDGTREESSRWRNGGTRPFLAHGFPTS